MAIALVAVSALAGYYVGSVTTTTALSPAGPCSIHVGPFTYFDSSNTTWMTDVYQMTPGSVGVICANYEFGGAGNYSFNSLPLACSSISEPNGTSLQSCTGLIKITPSLATFDHPTAQNITVAYTLQAEKNATGVYWFSIADCEWVPIAVGALPPSVAYPVIFDCFSFIPSPESEAVTGVSNMGVALVPVG